MSERVADPLQPVLNRLGLRTNPFYPTIGPDDLPVPENLIAKALDPRQDSRLVKYYFDVYDWQGDSYFGGISTDQALKKFPRREDLPFEGPVLVLVSGTGQTGRGSLVNLIVHKIGVAEGRPPLTVDVTFDNVDKQANVKDMARRFIYVYRRDQKLSEADARELTDLYDREIKEAGSGTESYLTTLFTTLKESLS
ncbi:MAG TPA: hypothetical protein VKT80_13115, partial [Chloroflexota bacterium]|nr:hypothetical protein [Chloroflexota bacterium]